MDPDQALADCRAALADANANVRAEGEDPSDELEALRRLGDAFDALDEWLTKGGFLPGAWERERERRD